MMGFTNQEGRGDAVLTATLSAILDALHDMRITLKCMSFSLYWSNFANSSGLLLAVNDQLSGTPSSTMPPSLPPSHGQSVSGTLGSTLVSELPPAIVHVSGITPNGECPQAAVAERNTEGSTHWLHQVYTLLKSRHPLVPL